MISNPIKQAEKELRELILEALSRAVANGQLPACPTNDFSTEVPADSAHGDFATNLAMTNAKVFGMPPRKIAEIVTENLVLDGSFFSRCEVAGPGFINFFLAPSWFSQAVELILQKRESYGKTDYGQGKKWMVEFVSANPTGPMHIGNARGGAMGDSLAEILSWAGFAVTREFYVNDAGNQIEKFAKSLSVRYLQLFLGEEKVPLSEDCYQGEDILAHARQFAEIYGDRYVQADETERRQNLVSFALPKNIQALKDDLARYRIHFDNWFLESELHKSGLVGQIVDELKKKGLTYEKEGAIWYRSCAFGCDKDDVLVRANGVPTYFAADIAYHYNKFALRHFDRVIDIWGADHHGHIARLKGALSALGISEDRLEVRLMQMVRLIQDGKPVKVSKRSGKSITLTSLLDEIPIDAARFFFNLREANSHFDFDLDLAVEQTAQNPVYYVEYAHARICSMLKTLAEEGFTPKEKARYELLKAPEEQALIRHLARFPQEIIDAANEYDPARMTRYAIALATLFHKFYTVCRVKGSEPELLQARLNLSEAARVVLKNVLSILKIQAPESM